MKLSDKQARLRWLYAEASTTLNDENATQEALQQADKYINEASALQEEITAYNSRQERMSGLKSFVEDGQGRQSVPDPREAGQSVEERAKGDGGFKSFGEFLVAARWRRDPRLIYEHQIFKGDQKDLAEAAGGAAGGIFVPHVFDMAMKEVAAEASVVRPRAMVIPMATRSVSIPVLDQTQNLSAQNFSGMFGGVMVEWTEEAAEKPETQPQFLQVELVVHKLTAYWRASDEILADSAVSLEAILSRLVGGANAWAEDFAFLRGDGVGKPLGILNAPALVKEARGTASHFKYGDAVDMLLHMLPQARPVFIMNPSVLPDLYAMADANNNYIWHPAGGVGVAAAAPATLLGLPVVFTEKLPQLGTEGDVLLADLSYYLIGDRQALTIASSTDERFRYDQVSWRCVSRVDGQPWMQQSVKSYDQALEFSPFVALQ